METLRRSSFLQAGTQPADSAGGPKACATCRLSHVSCDRKQPCGRCVRMGKAESCQPPPSRKRGRPRKAPPTDEQHQQLQPLRTNTTTPTPPAKRVCARPDMATDPPGDTSSQPAAGRPLPPILPRPTAANSPLAPSTTTSASSPSSASSSPADEDCVSSPPSSPSQTTTGSLYGHQRFGGSSDGVSDPHRRDPQPTAPAAAAQDPVLRSLLMLVVDQVREIRQENERLHDTIAQLRATQKEAERRLARVEENHQIRIRQLEQAHIELSQKLEHVMAAHRVHAHPSPAYPPPPQFSSSQPAAAAAAPLGAHHSPLAQPRGCASLPLVPAVTPTQRAEVERFIAQTLPFLQEFDCSSLILRDLRRPFVVMRIEEPETLDEMDTPIIVYASPAMCSLLGYDTYELHGAPICTLGAPEPEILATYVRMTLMRPSTPVGKPFCVSGLFATKLGRGVRSITQNQVLYNQRRLAQWNIMQVQEVIETDMEWAPLMKPVRNIVQDPVVRAHLLARLPHSLLFGRRGELATEQPDGDPHHQYDGNYHQKQRRHHQHHRHETHFEASFEQVGAMIEDLSTQDEEALKAAMVVESQRPPQSRPGRDATTHELRADHANNTTTNSELEELMRFLASPSQSGGGVRSPLFSRQSWTGFNSRPPPTPASLAERWMR